MCIQYSQSKQKLFSENYTPQIQILRFCTIFEKSWQVCTIFYHYALIIKKIPLSSIHLICFNFTSLFTNIFFQMYIANANFFVIYNTLLIIFIQACLAVKYGCCHLLFFYNMTLHINPSEKVLCPSEKPPRNGAAFR